MTTYPIRQFGMIVKIMFQLNWSNIFSNGNMVVDDISEFDDPPVSEVISNETLIKPFVWITSYLEYINIFYSMLIVGV